ncbi:MAG: DUF1761 domain-containing protein [Terriglobia bacterium]
MKAGKFLGAWLSYVLVTFAMGFVWHLIIFKKLYEELAIFSRINDPIIPLGFAAMLIQGAILAYLFPRLCRGGHPILEGIRFGLLTGVLIASSAVLAEAAKQRVTSLPTWLVLESSYYLIQFGLSGILIAYVYRNSTKAARKSIWTPRQQETRRPSPQNKE